MPSSPSSTSNAFDQARVTSPTSGNGKRPANSRTTQARCTCTLSPLTPTMRAPARSTLVCASTKARTSVGQTNVKSAG